MLDLSNNCKETANSYIIKEPGNYKLPLVYGCGFKNGVDNPRSYTKASIIEEDFLDYKGKLIEKAEIQYKVGGIKIISWDSSRETIRDLRIEGDYMRFSITQVPEGGANYVIAIFDDQGIIIWSWHIWLCGFKLRDIRQGNYTFLDTPLASKKEKSGKINIWYYQWGRKDPICYLNKMSSVIRRKPTNIMRAIQNPRTLYYNAGGTWNWLDKQLNHNYWSEEKTIYDPCPPGYKVPGKEALRAISCTSYRRDPNRKGYRFGYYDMFIPLSGLKLPSGVYYKGERGVFWGTGVDNFNDQYGFALSIKNRSILVASYVRTNAAGIIPQKYDN